MEIYEFVCENKLKTNEMERWAESIEKKTEWYKLLATSGKVNEAYKRADNASYKRWSVDDKCMWAV